MTIDLSDAERARYEGQIHGGLGFEGQLRLKRARVIVIGAGAAGSAAATELASRGVGYVAVVDGGTVELGDLAGQAIYYTPDVGQSKADTLAGKLGLLNPEVHVESYPVDLEQVNAAAIVAGHDVVLDCTHDRVTAGALDATGALVLRLPADRARDSAAGIALAGDAVGALARSTVEAPQ